MQKNNKSVEALEELKEFAIQQNKDFSKLFDTASEYKKQVIETSYSRDKKKKTQEMIIQDVGMEYEGPVLE